MPKPPQSPQQPDDSAMADLADRADLRSRLPDITLTHVEFADEQWDFGRNLSICASVNDPQTGQPVMRQAVAVSRFRQVRPPRYQTRDVVFEIWDTSPSDPDARPRYVTQSVDILVDPGESRPLTPDELAKAQADARAYLIERLRYAVLTGQLLTPTPAPEPEPAPKP